MKSKTIISLLMMAVMILANLSIVVSSESGYNYIDQNGQLQITGELIVTPITADTSVLTTGWYVVSSQVARNGAITVEGNVNLILADGYTLSVTGSSNRAGILVLNGNTLTIYGQEEGTGTLNAQGGQYGSGIGGTLWELGGTTNINGGTIHATGGQYGAGIGGGYNANAGTTKISGGTVTATGGQNSAGIGGSYYYTFGAEFGSGGTIIITGGNITANGNGYGAGIGGGQSGQSGNISISGGVVHATSGKVSGATGAAGIGGGVGRGANKITISGGTVVATALDYGAGIGGGDRGNGGEIEIAGGQVTAISHSHGAGIGGGWGGSGGTITINSGTVIATAIYGGAGIGGGWSGSSGTINIHGGHVTAHGGQWGAGIGGGGGASCNTITITDGIVNAIGDYNAKPESGGAGIGSGGANRGGSQSGGIIKILGGKVTAKGGSLTSEYARDIGRGRNGINGEVFIDDAAVITLMGQGMETLGTVFGTCVIKGSGASAQAGAYENGTRLTTTVIDLEASTLSSGEGYSVSGNTVTLSGSGNTYALAGDTNNRNVTVASGSSADVILFAANIASASGSAFNMNGATVNMCLISNNRLSSGPGFAGLQAPYGSVLTIDGSGSLTASGGNNGAGIGGANSMAGGSISIIGGTVKAIGQGGGAGVGGGNDSDGGTVLVDGEDTVLTATGGLDGFDIGSGNRRINGGTLELNHNATVNLTRNGTDALKNYRAGTVSGEGAEGDLDAGQYLNFHKLLTCTGITVSPSSGAKAFDPVDLTVHVTGLSYTRAQGEIIFYDNGSVIGRASLNHMAQGSTNAMAVYRNWRAWGGTHLLTAEYVQNPDWESYYMPEAANLTYEVARAEQATLNIVGIPDSVTYNDPPFSLAVSGGNSTGKLSYAVTEGDAVTIEASTGLVTVIKAGTATITVTKAGDSNYHAKSTSIDVIVKKAAPTSVIYPSADTITYEQTLFASELTGSSGDGTFSWEKPDTIPIVNNSGYTVIFTPNDMDNYDYSDVILSKTVNITVNKANPIVKFPLAGEITYGQPLSESTLTGGSGDGRFMWENPDTIPDIVNDGYNIIFTPHDPDNYNSLTKLAVVSVRKADQVSLSIMKPSITYGDLPSYLSISGGSGTGSLSYAVTEGDAVTIDACSGLVTVIKAGTATITVTKAGDSNYHAKSTSIDVIVKKAAPTPVIYPSADTITYGQTLSASELTGSSGDGTFSWENPDTIPIVNNTGYTVIFTPNDMDNYDYSDVALSQMVDILVNKATPAVIFPTAGELTYGQPLSDSLLSGGIGAGTFDWGKPNTIPSVNNTGYPLVFTPSDIENYKTIEQTVAIVVSKAPSVSPTPSPISTEKPSPTATPIPSTAPSLAPTASPTSTPVQTPIPSTDTAIPNPTLSPVPTVSNPRDTAPPTAYPSATVAPSSQVDSTQFLMLKPLSIQVDKKTDKIALTINIDDLADDTMAIRLLSGEYIQIDAEQKTLELFLSQDDINQDGEFVITMLDQDDTSLGNYQLDISVDAWQNEIINHNKPFDSIFVWIALGTLVIGGALTTVFILNKKR